MKYVEYEALVGRAMMNPGDRSAHKLMTDIENRYLSMLKHPITQGTGKDKRWRTHIDDPDRKEKRQDIKGRTKEEVEQKVIKAFMEMEERSKKKPAVNANVKVGEYVDRWIESQRETRHATNSIQKYKSAKRRFFDAEWARDFAQKRVIDVDYIDIENFLKKCISECGLTAKAAHDPVSYTKQIFDTAVRDRLIESNPFRECDVRKYVYRTCREAKIVDDEKKILTDTQVRDLIAAVEKHLEANPTYMPDYGVLIYLWTGLRCGELPARKWSEIQDGELRIITSEKADRILTDNGTCKTVYKIARTKTSKTRAVTICPALQKVLDRIKGIQEQYGIVTDYIMEGPKGLYNGSEIGKAIERRGREAGIEHCSAQRIRRTVDSKIAGKLPFSEVVRQMGHGPSVDMVYYQYSTMMTSARADTFESLYPIVPKSGQKENSQKPMISQ